jgi:transcriptional regulator with XRE-family HTH domain
MRHARTLRPRRHALQNLIASRRPLGSNRVSRKPAKKQPPGRSVAYWLREVLVSTRERDGVMRVEVASLLKKDQSTIAKYEKGAAKLPAEIDRYVAAYAQATGTDPRDLWQEAIERWRRSGAPPLLNPGEAEEPADALERAVRETARRPRQGRGSPPGDSAEKPPATPRKRATS